jgi:hypothetical protein
VSDIANLLNSMSGAQLGSLGVWTWARPGAYKRVFYLFDKIARALAK